MTGDFWLAFVWVVSAQIGVCVEGANVTRLGVLSTFCDLMHDCLDGVGVGWVAGSAAAGVSRGLFGDGL